MTPMVSVRCPGCNRTLRLAAEHLGRPAKCSACGQVMRTRAKTPPPGPNVPPAPAAVPRKRRLPLAAWAVAGLLGIVATVCASFAPWTAKPTPSVPEDIAKLIDEAPTHPVAAFVAALAEEKKAASAAVPSYARDVRPIVEKYCFKCHAGAKKSGGVLLDREKDDAEVKKAVALWERAGDNLRSGEMPPAGSPKPTAAEAETLNRWLDAVVFRTDCSGPKNPGRVTIRRLNRTEYNNTIRDLVGIDFKPAKDFPADDVGYGFDNIGDVLSLPPLLMEKYLEAAEKIIDEALAKAESKKRLLPVSLKDKGALPTNLKTFATKAWRRPVTADEMTSLMRFPKMAREAGDGPEMGARLAFQAVLISPNFLFRIEGNPGADGNITQHELATRLSYFLWSSMPDDELTKLADEKKLREPGVIEGQVRRMLKDRKAEALAENFAGQWLNTRSLPALSFDPKRFPTYTPALRQAMVRETELFFLHVARENASVLDFIDGPYAFVNEPLAKHYGIDGVKGRDFRKVDTSKTPRAGVLTQAAVLAVTSNPTRTSPVKRGKWILDNILGTPPPPPPPDAPELPEEGELKGSLRQQMEQHRKNPSCAGCHQRMDPLGFGFENFDAVGAWRTRDGGHAVDASGVLPDGSKFSGPAELRKVLLAKKEQFVKCFADKMLTYALGRGTERSDRCFIEEIATAAAKDDYKFERVVIDVVKSDPFQKRRQAAGEKK